jgi:hypothetical protein
VVDGGRSGDLVVLAVEVEWFATPRPAQHGDELACPVIAAIVVEPISEAALLDGVATGHDIQQKPSARDALER